MSRGSSLVALALAALLVAPGCGGYSQNHRRGLLAVAGAAVITGSVIAADGAWCDDTANGDADCADDRGDLVTGLALLGAGLALGGAAYFVRPPDTSAPRAEAAAGPVVTAPAKRR